jgi:D-glycero-beta-D-manno-heptose-7-phosphate kinase
MSHPTLSLARVKDLLKKLTKARVLVVGDVMLDQFVWGRVSRISPEAPVPVVDFDRESFMPGGAANVARNLADLKTPVELFGAVGKDETALKFRKLLTDQTIVSKGLLAITGRNTSIKTRIVAQQQQVVRLDRETRDDLTLKETARLLKAIEAALPDTDAIIIGDYGKGVVTQPLLDELKALCRPRGIWLSLDPKPVHKVDISGVSLITPNRKEAFELAGMPDQRRATDPLKDEALLNVAEKLLGEIQPALLLITLSELGMLLCKRDEKPFHIPTVAQEVFDVSGAGDTVIATFTAAIAAGASPVEAAIFSNHASGVVVGKVGTATVTPEELLASFQG